MLKLRYCVYVKEYCNQIIKKKNINLICQVINQVIYMNKRSDRCPAIYEQYVLRLAHFTYFDIYDAVTLFSFK